jgi:hypothetical protein
VNNWKTTLFGVIAAAATALSNYSGANNWQGYMAAAAMAAFGFIAKDYNTHSTSAQVQTATKEATAAAIASANTVK